MGYVEVDRPSCGLFLSLKPVVLGPRGDGSPSQEKPTFNLHLWPLPLRALTRTNPCSPRVFARRLVLFILHLREVGGKGRHREAQRLA